MEVPGARSARLPISPGIAVATGVLVLLVGFAGGYGYHADELYFLAAGRHLAWAYPDQGPLTPAVAHAMDLLSAGSLTLLRVPSALMLAAAVTITGLMVRELGGGRRAEWIATLAGAASGGVLFASHLLGTPTFGPLAWAAVTSLAGVAGARGGPPPLLPA